MLLVGRGLQKLSLYETHLGGDRGYTSPASRTFSSASRTFFESSLASRLFSNNLAMLLY